MAVNINRPFMNNTGLTEQNCLNNLLHVLSPDLENEPDIIDHSKYYNDNDFRNVLQSGSEISILNLNCLNLKTRFDKLKLFLADVDPYSHITCITIQGTCFDENTDLAFYSIPGYTLISDAYRISSHCGVAIYVHNDFSYVRTLMNIISPVFENIAIEISRNSTDNTKYLISTVYRPPTGLIEDLSTFINDFSIFLVNVQNRYRKAYVCGDININLLKINENNHFNSFYESVTSHGFMPQITLPTRLSDTCDTLIDNIFTNNLEKKHTNCILTRVISDHQMTCCILPDNKTRKNMKILVEVENVNEFNLSNIRNELIEINIFEKLNLNIHDDPNHNYQIVSTILTDLKTKHIPKKIRRFNKRKDKKEKWMTNELLMQINTKNDMYVDWKSNSNNLESYQIKKINFKTYERIVDKKIEETKKKYYYDTFRNHKNCMKNTWKTINETLGKNKKDSKLPTYVQHNNTIVSNPTEIANVFNDFFVNIGSNLSSTINTNDDNFTFKQYLQTPSTSTCILNNICENDVLKLIHEMDNKSSSGNDCISNKMLKYIKNEISKAVALIINQMLNSGIFPNRLKISKIIPVYKKGNANLLNNYRPISLLPTISKIFERVIYNQLYNYFIDNQLLSEQQYGFRAKHSTELAVLKLVDYIKHAIDQKRTPVNIYIDLSKAFDTLNFDILLYKLSYYGVTGTTLKLIESYLTNRVQYVKYDTHQSTLKQIKTGVPQGSILGPLLFSIYINDLVTVNSKFKFVMYADDTTIYFDIEDFNNDEIENHINNELNKVNIWLKQNMLSLNAEKTKCMIFHTRQRHIEPRQFSIDGKEIENVKFFKFLGIIFDEHLTWKSHTKMVTNKLSKLVGIIYRLKHVYPQQALLLIYNSIFISHINYGLLLWGTQLKEVFNLQKKAVRIITCSDYIAHSEPLFKLLGLLKVQDLYQLKVLKFYYNLSYKLLPSYFDNYLDIINNDIECIYELRRSARPLIRLPRTRLMFTESTLLYELIKIINSTYDEHPGILEKIKQKSHSYSGFSFNITRVYLEIYEYECHNLICYVCDRGQ